MKVTRDEEASSPLAQMTEMLILPDGKVLVHNLTPAMASLLNQLNPATEEIHSRTVTSDAVAEPSDVRPGP